MFQASLTGRRRALSTAQLLRMAVRYPLMTARVTALIHCTASSCGCAACRACRRPDHTPQEGVG